MDSNDAERRSDLPTVAGDDLGGVFPRVFDEEYLEIARGDGPYLWDSDGNRYIDAVSGNQNANVGHGVEEIAEAAADQLRTLEYVGMEFATEATVEFTSKVASFAPDGFEHVWLVSGGSEATESALKMAVQYHVERGNGRKWKVVARRRSYHGNTVGAASMSGFPTFHAELDVVYQDFPVAAGAYPAHCHICDGTAPEDCTLGCADDLERTIVDAGPQNVAAFVAEPVTGSPNPGASPPPGYFERVREICDEYDVLFVVDEVLTGFGRTGENFAIEHRDVTPDIIATGKGMSAGYTPLGGVLPHERVVDLYRDLPHGFSHGHTYSFNPASARIGSAVMDYTRRHSLVENAATVGAYLGDRLRSLLDLDVVGDVRGQGLLYGVEFTADPEGLQPLIEPWRFLGPLEAAALENGVLVAPMGEHVGGDRGAHIMVAPPLVADEDLVDEIVSRTRRAIETAAAAVEVE